MSDELSGEETTAEEETVEATETVDAEGGPGESRLNLASTNFGIAALSAICGTNQSATTALGGQTLGLHSGPPGVNGANAHPNTGNTTRKAISWGTPTGGGAAEATVSAAPIEFKDVPTGTYSHYGVYNGNGQFLYGKALSSTVTVPASATGTITVTPRHNYDLT